MDAVRHAPPELSCFVGRAEALALLAGSAAAGQVLTLVGPGGCGKTRLALRSARQHAAERGGQAWWIGLEDSDHRLVLGCIDSLESIAAVLADHGERPVAGVLVGAADRARDETGYPTLAHVYAKLGVANRTDLARLAAERASEPGRV